MTELIATFLGWYLIVQLVTLAALPLTLRVFVNLPDRGYAFAKSLGILLVSIVLWLGTSYGLLRNETGGAWLSLIIVAVISAVVAVPGLIRRLQPPGGGHQNSGNSSGSGRLPEGLSPRYVLIVELLFFFAFAAWAWVRVNDPAANHTEQPMDLMFMNSIWSSPTYPPYDAWLGGYAISYYYLGYWMLTTLGRLAGQPPEIAYNVGQAAWFGLLLIGSFGVVYNLAAADKSGDRGGDRGGDRSDDLASDGGPPIHALLGGFLGAVAVGVAGNMQGILEWMHANGVNITRLASWFDVAGFPENASITNNWFIDNGWWWWRSSRVIEDLDLLGNHIEVIDEFPIFSYILGDNHPHVLAMPFALLVVGLALNIFLQPGPRQGTGAMLARLRALMPLGWGGLLLVTVAAGSLVFLNTWDFPPYWLLLTLVIFVAAWRRPRAATMTAPAPDSDPEFESEPAHTSFIGALLTAIVAGVIIVVGTVAIYLPYFLTAQSQAGGFAPNLFNPTRLPQFLLMFAPALLALLALIGLVWRFGRPAPAKLAGAFAAVYGLPVAFLAMSIVLATRTESGRDLLNRMALPDGATEHLPFIIERWTRQPFTFLLIGALLAVVVALLWQLLADNEQTDQPAIFALLLAAIGLLLVYAPEFVYLRDNFGTRMNTVFKFYYQAWLLFGLSGAYAIAIALRAANWRRGSRGLLIAAPATLALLLIIAALVFPIAGAYGKAGGFQRDAPTFDAIAYVQEHSPDEMAAIKWIRANTAPDALILEGKGSSYQAETSRISAATGRPTLLGWDGHESQWRGGAYGEMAQLRPETLDLIYRTGSPQSIAEALADWNIDYLFIGPNERFQYDMTSETEARLQEAMDLVFEAGDVRIYQRRGE